MGFIVHWLDCNYILGLSCFGSVEHLSEMVVVYSVTGYFSCQPVFHSWYNKGCGVCYSILRYSQYIRHLILESYNNITVNNVMILMYGEARCSSVVRAFVHDAMGRRIDPS